MALELFSTKTFNPRLIVYKTGSYTVVSTDEQVNVSGGAYTLTLPALDSLQGTIYGGEKVYLLKNTDTGYTATVQPGTSATTGVADTIGKRATYALKPGESVFITGFSGLTDWLISSPIDVPGWPRFNLAVDATTNGTTAVNVFDATGAPYTMQITEVMVNALDTIAGNITLTNGASTVITIAKGTTLAAITGATTLAYPSVTAGSTLTVVSDSTGNGRVTITYTVQ